MRAVLENCFQVAKRVEGVAGDPDGFPGAGTAVGVDGGAGGVGLVNFDEATEAVDATAAPFAGGIGHEGGTSTVCGGDHGIVGRSLRGFSTEGIIAEGGRPWTAGGVRARAIGV